ncbi:hypothetical protein BN7_3429 [Wickerhamomyces ciferrii]|uniref:Uncharacterized protein n=1 Tax=Wickerhamomyces ciferrii (strain ATCC 14091 / BCRC 22168 / CBS 111 / JCM 3599 / NBRC 0793 / NRRL Y-1031 F-60-10) TaxID=1206466 RepID=K0KFH3_WICCF|nr:uncharacterized protein BN7_3429 [Wickerhamomyces ciferrii]CCH43875.1 hypothetical protein BN7_3429 [Wickerhamomyces ciferrii]
MSKYQKLQELYQKTELPDLELEKKYQNHLSDQINQYQHFINLAKSNISKNIPINQEIPGIFETNKKIPFNIERGDTLGISLANNYTDSQISQSKEYIKILRQRSLDLDNNIQKKQELNDKLDVFLQGLETRLLNETQGESIDEIDKLQDQLLNEKIRYRTLRKELQNLSEEYE